MNQKKLAGDFLLNVLAALILLFTTEFIVLPRLAVTMNSDDYGHALMLLGIVTTLSSALGNGLNNVRLILHHKYEKQQVRGDYPVIFCGLGVALLFICIYIEFLGWFSASEIAVLFALTLLGSYRLYLSVTFRLRVNYLGNLLLNGVLSLGYLIGLAIGLANAWWAVFILGEILSLGYLIYVTDWIQEPFRRTPLFGDVCKCFAWLGYLTLLGGLLNIMDRNVILPILGGEAVSVLFVAMIAGKAVSYVAKPMGNVMLSYFAQPTFVMTRRKYWGINLATVVVGAGCYLLSIAISEWMLHCFYPMYADKAMPLVMHATSVPVLLMVSALAQPAVLRFVKLSILSFWQSLYVAVYIGMAVLLTSQYGLYGFCYAASFLVLLRILILWWLGARNIGKGVDE